ncbi:ABC transporter permease [Actinacidiphila soli]|uniref:ABC transporter permease n=1 Tax=Actinacidiphila soli TaxID=2487275 RepID=UPI000FCAE7F8|nr:ABC transporter permease [Actinacidiphila soli]
MSVSTHAPNDASTAAAPDHTPRPRPGIGVAIKVEITKLMSQPTLRIVLALCVVVPAGFAILMRAGSNRPSDTLFGRWAGTSGFATSLTVLNWAAAYGAPLLAGLFAGDIFASEDRHGTWKTILTRSCIRSRLFLGKAVAATVCVWFSFVVIGVVSLLAGLAAVGSSPLVGLSGQLVGSGQALGLVAASWILSLLWTSVFVALGLLLSVVSRSGIVGVLGPLVVGIVLQLLETIASGQVVRSILPTTPSDAWHVFFTAPVPAWPIIQAVVTDVGYTAVFAGTAWYLLRRRDFAGADAMPAGRRRTTVRIGIATAAIGALLGGFSTVGPTALTATRLDTSIATTFGHLAEVRYQWQTGAQADPTIPWHAVCNRGGTPIGATVPNSTGAGDDWSCTISDLRASDGVGTNVLDVTLKANGCYEVQSPPGAVGPLYVTDDRGRTFFNPLFAFDGCLGTP